MYELSCASFILLLQKSYWKRWPTVSKKEVYYVSHISGTYKKDLTKTIFPVSMDSEGTCLSKDVMYTQIQEKAMAFFLTEIKVFLTLYNP